MSRALPPKTAREMRDYFARVLGAGQDPVLTRWVRDLDRCIQAKRSVQKAKVRRSEKKKSRETLWRNLKDKVRTRAANRCECCGRVVLSRFELDVDHIFGGSDRQALESAETVWAICRYPCHDGRTQLLGGYEHWLRLFREHALRYGFTAAAREAERRIDKLAKRSRLPFSPTQNERQQP